MPAMRRSAKWWWIRYWRRWRRRHRARWIGLALPTLTDMEGNAVAAYELKNDRVATIAILVRDNAGDVVPAPAGDVFSALSSNPASLRVEIGADANGAPAVVLTPLVRQSPGLSFTVSDSSGLTAFTEPVDIVEDLAPKAIGLDLADVVEADQPVPDAAGP
jgi:hypothetical protein